MRYLLALGLLLLLKPNAQAQQAQLEALLQRYHVPGMQLMYTKGRTTKAYHVGVRQAGTSQPVTDATVFEACSLGKEVLAYVALRYYDRGLLDLDKPLLRYYDEPRLRGQPRAARITARLGLAHMAGLPNWAENPLGAGWATSALVVQYAPDSCWNYSAEGYGLVQRALEHLSGKPLEVLAREEVFTPLGLLHSSFQWQAQFAATASAGHDETGKAVPIDHFTAPNAGYSLYATATDYNRFLQALRTGRGLQPATARLLQTPATAANRCGRASSAADPYIAWACGVGLATTSQGLGQWQWGDNTNFKGFFLTLPGKNESLVFFTNSANGNKLTDELLHLFFGPGQYWTTQWLAAR